MKWTQLGNGYYSATGRSGIVLCIMQCVDGWKLFVGDKMGPFATCRTLRARS